jgi:hypothetical protein
MGTLWDISRSAEVERIARLDSGSRNEEPFVVDAVDRGRSEVLAGWNMDGSRCDAVSRVLHSGVLTARQSASVYQFMSVYIQGDSSWLSLAGD